jgi:ribosomal protection tetracycline resistance protein
LLNARATIQTVAHEETSHRVIGEIPTAELRAVEQLLPRLTRGDGGWASRFAGHRRVSGDAPMRPRIGPNPLNRALYLAEVARS